LLVETEQASGEPVVRRLALSTVAAGIEFVRGKVEERRFELGQECAAESVAYAVDMDGHADEA
jgi:hypothetical protein